MMKNNPKQVIQTTLMAWLAMIGFDFLLHASILAPLYANPVPFLLSVEKSFKLIPLGYLSFLFLAILLTWLIIRLNINSGREGLIFGLKIGGLVWGSVVLGLLSISTAEPALMLGWFLGQSFEMGIAGFVIGIGNSDFKTRKLGLWVTLFFILSVITGILIQNL